MCEQIRAITVDRLQKNIGRLDQQSMKAIDDGMKITLDLQ